MDTGQGEIIRNIFESVSKVYKQSSTMLDDAEAVLKERGYTCLNPGNSIGTEQSKDRTRPRRWITPYVALYFEEEDSSSPEILGLGVFFSGLDMMTPIEPIVVFGIFEMPEDDDGTRHGHNNWYLKEAWFRLLEHPQVGTEYAINNDHRFSNEFTGAKVTAAKLDEITDINTLKARVIDVLTEMHK